MTTARGPTRIVSSPTSLDIVSASVPVPAWVPDPGKFSYASTGTAKTDIPAQYQYPAGGTFGGSTGWGDIWAAWNGACFIPTIGALGSLMFWGGGHYGYYGDEMIQYDIAARTFTRFLPTSPYAVTVAGSGIPDDTTYLRHTPKGNFMGANNAGVWFPVPFHTYCSPTYLPPDAGGAAPLGSYYLTVMTSTGSPTLPPCAWTLDLNTKTWTYRMDLDPPPGNPNFVSVLHWAAVYDPKRKVIWTGSGEGRYLWRMNLMTNVANIARGNYDTYVSPSISEACTVYVPPPYDLHFGCAQGTSRPAYWGIDLANSPTATSGLTTITRNLISIASPENDPYYKSGVTGVEPHAQYQWIDVGDGNPGIYMVMPSNGQYGNGLPTLHKLTPPAAANWKTQPWTWTKETLAAQNGTETSQLAGDYYSRWQYIPALKCVLYNCANSLRVVAARHSSWT